MRKRRMAQARGSCALILPLEIVWDIGLKQDDAAWAPKLAAPNADLCKVPRRSTLRATLKTPAQDFQPCKCDSQSFLLPQNLLRRIFSRLNKYAALLFPFDNSSCDLPVPERTEASFQARKNCTSPRRRGAQGDFQRARLLFGESQLQAR